MVYLRQMKKGLIFDFDGVICDSEKFHHKAWQEVAAALGVEFGADEYVPYQSTGRKKVISYLAEKAGATYSEDLFQRLSAVKSEAFARLTRDVGPSDMIAGAERFIKRAYASGATLAVASSASTARQMLRTLSLDAYFAAVVDGSDGYEKKPSPAVFIAAAEKIGLKPSECVVFEDSPAGVTGAKNGGFEVVGIGKNLANADFPVFDDFIGVEKTFFGE